MNNIETMRLALEALLEGRAWLESDAPKEAWDKNNQAITSLRQAIEQAQQDVDWEKLYRLEVKKKEAIAAKYEQDIKPLTKIVPMAQQAEPVAWLNPYGGVVQKRMDGHERTCYTIPLYTSPPPRQPLTDEEMKAIWYAMQNIMGWYSFQEIARAIEAAHGIKENT